MRIISGTLRGRLFDAPDTGKTHPMGEKPRGALFNALGDIKGLTVLDAYAGSGSISFEAISRGATSVVAVEHDKSAFKTLVRNINAFDLKDVVNPQMKNMKVWSDKNLASQFDLVVCDPPYDAVLARDIERLMRHVKDNGILVLSWPSKVDTPGMQDGVVLKEKTYAGARLIFYRKK